MRDEDGIPSSVPLSTVTRLEVSRGQKSKASVGVWVGTGLGLMTGVAICSSDACSILGNNDIAGEVFLLTGVGGLILGALIGSRIKGDRWEEVPLDRLGVSLTPQRDGRLALGFSVRF